MTCSCDEEKYVGKRVLITEVEGEGKEEDQERSGGIACKLILVREE